MRFLSDERCLIRCRRKRASSRAERVSGSGSQIAGTRSSCDRRASTWASILSVLQASGASPLDLVGVGDLDAPAVFCQDVADEARSGHRLDDGRDRLFVNSDLGDQVSKTVGIGRRGRARYELSVVAQYADVEAPAAEIQSSVQHGLLWWLRV